MKGKVNLTADVVVVGYGCAGAAAAIAAHDEGARVLVLEGSHQGGGNTLVSFGGFICPDEPDAALAYLAALLDLARSERDDRLLQVFVEEAARTRQWLSELDRSIEVIRYGAASYPGLPGAHAIKRYVVNGAHRGATAFAQNLWQVLSRAVETDRRIPVLTGRRARRLLTDEAGAVVGVAGEGEERTFRVAARRGVVLATGGYEFDPELLQNSVKGHPLHALGHPGNRGDGVRMAQKVGAQLWHMNAVSCAFGLKAPEYEAAFAIEVGGPGQILVDGTGRRFINEAEIARHAALLAVDFFDSRSLTYPRIPCYLIFDEKTRLKGPISTTAGLGHAGVRHNWSRDNSVEIEKGWIEKGETLAKLAQVLGIPEAPLVITVQKWNTSVRLGEDRLMGRRIPEERRAATIESGPFYALRLHPCLANTQGGPRHNEHGEVLDAFGARIPGLFSAGELGSMWGMVYQGGGNIAEGLAFGRIAGRNAAAGWQVSDNCPSAGAAYRATGMLP